MTPLRQTMIQAMCQHGFSPRTQHSYLYVVTALARYYRRLFGVNYPVRSS
ncbi:hypothetical protein MIH18_05880 [Marinobacter sp. M3C]|jgi:hypothetical protein|nr:MULTISPECIES: hypothetical protein [unclassified Marinobacter]UQG57360.1 hypothetical protein MIH16_06885 [Marinobacter sp. M4C]UQG61471.1 hypothetical protein MIH18_05880 [Marinobacter sp. M3C]UQG66164.1 hypothetical protein MIH17_06885 [Marinobacter sp. M2C]UQG70444.1 hypothetical protein MIH19_06880 [Marinobacter sp. M1C]